MRTRLLRVSSVAAVVACQLALMAPARAQATIHHVVGQTNDWLGWSVAGLGDITHDGVPDFAVGAPELGSIGVTGGYVRVCSGADGSVLATLHGSGDGGGNFGTQVAAAGDVNADGTPDILVGEPKASLTAFATGVVWVFSGADFSVLFSFAGTAGVGLVGGVISGAGDVNADGHADVLIHSRTFNKVFMVSGLDGTIIHTVADEPTDPDADYMSVAPAGDINKDGFDDVLVGFPYDLVDFQSKGSAWLFSGRDGSILLEWHGAFLQEAFGYAVSSAGDANADGVPDIAVSSLKHGGPALSAGSVSIFSGADGSLLHLIQGEVIAPGFGWDVAGLGDVDGDGHDDLAVSSVFSDTLSATAFEGSAVLVYSGADAHRIMTLSSNTLVFFFGRSIDRVGDLDGDGRADILVGSNAEPLGGDFNNAGGAWVYSSQPWTDLGFGLAGSSGVPHLAGTGTLAPGSHTSLHLSGALPGGSAVLIAGAGLLQAPFKGGTLVPTLDLLAFGLPISAAGTLDLAFPWPNFLPPTAVVRFQYWIPASGGPQGFSASNAVSGTQP